MRARLALVRLGPLVALALLCGVLLLTSSLQRLVPAPPPPAVWLLVLAGASLVALLPALLARGSPLPSTLAVVVPVLLAASYGAGRLDWLRTLKNFHLLEAGGPDLLRVGLGLLALLLAWGLHALDTSFRLRWRSQERGIPPAQARAAARAVLRRGGLHALLALAGAVLLGGVVLLAALVGPALLPVERMAFLAPLAAGLLLLVAALLLVGVPRKASADE